MHLRRRQFLRTLAGAWPWATAPFAVQAQAARRTVAILGDTQRGGFGHDLDTVFLGRPDLGDVVVADPDLAGRARVVKRVGAVRAHADWRTLIEKERPWLACIAMRHATPHFEIARAALEAGAHLYVEKPFVTTLGEADALLALAKARGLRIAVAHSMRMAPAVRRLLQVIHEEGRLGELRSLRAHGKQDARAGGEDLMVLGTHLMDLMRLFAGNPQWVHASILQDGRPITQSDRRRVKDDVGWVAGDHVHATFGFRHGVHGSFVSDAPSRDTSGHWGVEWVGTLGSARILADLVPRVLVRVHPQ
ncbi:MAG: Gfo/Idh/MocA family protein, partial [Verrucomicrobiota bacterium]